MYMYILRNNENHNIQKCRFNIKYNKVITYTSQEQYNIDRKKYVKLERKYYIKRVSIKQSKVSYMYV